MLRGYPAFHFICIGNRCFKRDLLFRCSCSVWAVAHLGLDQLCGKRTALPHPAGLWLYIPWLQQGGGIKAEWNRFSAVSPVCFSWFHQRNKKEQIEKKKKVWVRPKLVISSKAWLEILLREMGSKSFDFQVWSQSFHFPWCHIYVCSTTLLQDIRK